uniref:NACHT domain-containing protein n=1 Tax=Sinocyclocheilus grahami TaxID=75366 RepID=A0A672T9N3_SINGR
MIPDYPACSVREEEDDEDQTDVRDAALKITLHVLRKMNQTDLANSLQTSKSSGPYNNLRAKFCKIHEGISLQGKTTLLHEIYTELYITEGGRGEMSFQHEVRQIETTSWTPETPEAPIKCNDIFKALPGQNKRIRSVLTKGVAGIGKTIVVQKFILDWAEGKDNQNVHFIFPLPFRELNLMKEKNISLMELLRQFFTELRLPNCDDYKIIFIFDGLDECRFPLDFQNNDILCDVTESASVDVLLTNLIKGNLLPSALLWITSRPAAANQIPAECVDKVTEVRGFNDPQKDEYFRKRISDQSLANRIITHVKSSRSLYIMCHIPVFCWISANVLERMLSEAESAEIPKTLTQMFTHFLIYQIKQRKNVFSLGKLAFQQLEKGNLIFYEADLRECGIDVREVSVYSGLCTQIFREEFGLYLGKVYSFVHLSFQEFLAALFKFLSLILKPTKHFKLFSSTMTDLLKREVDRALQSDNGHLDLYVRFLLGLSLESNQRLLQGLLTHTGNVCLINKQKIIKYLKEKIKDNPSPEKSINLFHCLNELNDHSLVQEVQAYLKETGPSGLSGVKLSPAQWSALGFVLLNSENELDEFKLSKYDQSEECLLRLLPVVKASRKDNPSPEKSINLFHCLNELNDHSLVQEVQAYLKETGPSGLSGVKLSPAQWSALGFVLLNSENELDEFKLSKYDQSEECLLRLLPVVKASRKIVDQIKHFHYFSPRLCDSNLTEKSCSALASVISSNSSSLADLDMSNNNLQDSGVKLLCAGLKNPQCKLETLHVKSHFLCRLSNCRITVDGCAALASALRTNLSHLRKLNLSDNTLGDPGVNLLSGLLEDPQSKLGKL